MSILTIIAATAVAIAPADSAMWQMTMPAYDNPAVRQWAMPASHSAIGIGYMSDKLNRAVNPQTGTGERHWTFGADTYLKYRTSTLWGEASYDNGRQTDRVWNETSDPELVYPCFTADSVGGDMKLERYRFGGGYADHAGRWGWGAQLSYQAGLYYRDVDPRPKNVTGKLDMAVGGTFDIAGDYVAGLSVNYRKYKQSNDIAFKSVMGVDKLYHTTGLGTHYGRFAGLGDNSYYNGHRWGGTLNLYPMSGRGFSATLNMSRFEFTKVLSDLNKLPLADVWHNALTAQAAYVSAGRRHDWTVTAQFDTHRRHVVENQFGDAASGIYPQIGALELYADNGYTAMLNGLWQWHNNRGTLAWLKPTVAYRHGSTLYLSPERQKRLSHLDYGLSGLLTAPAGKWRFTVSAAVACSSPLSHLLEMRDDGLTEPAGLVAAERQIYEYQRHHTTSTTAGLKVARNIHRNFSLQLSGQWRHDSYFGATHGNRFDVSLAVLF